MGTNSFFNKLYTYSPLNHLGLGKYDPVGSAFFNGKYSTSSGPGTPGPYAGATPTLADANAGYVRAAAGAAQPVAGGTAASMNNLFNAQQPPPINPVQRPVMNAQPIIPGQQQQQRMWG